MSLTLFDTIRRIVHEEFARIRTAELGVVQEQHPHESDSDSENYSCTVQLRNSGTVLKRVPVATTRLGSVTIPPVGSLVLVQFIGGDINGPVVTSSFYSDEDRPPVNKDGQSILHFPLGAGDSDAVHIELTTGDTREITIRLGTGLKLTLRDDDPSIELDVDGGKAALKIEKDGSVKLKSDRSIELEASDITIKASGQLVLKGDSEVNIN